MMHRSLSLCVLLVFSINTGVQAKTDVWKRLTFSTEAVTALAVAPSNPGRIFAGTASGALFRIEDGLPTPLVTELGSRSNPVTAIAVDPRDSNTVYAATADGLFKSVNAGIGWMNLSRDVIGAFAVIIDPQDSNVVYAAADALGLFKSTDAGAQWFRVLSGGNVQSVVIDVQNTATLYAGTSRGVAKSVDGGMNWFRSPWSGGTVRSLAIDPRMPSTLYAGDATGGVFKSMDGGFNWISSGLNSIPVFGLVVDTQESSTVYAATAQGPFKSVDAGRNWFAISEGLSAPITAIAGDFALCKVYIAAGDGVFETDVGPVLTLHSNLCVGDAWSLVVSHALGGSAIRLLGVSNGNFWEVSNWSVTNGAGMYVEDGNFPAYAEGFHQLRIDAAGAPSNTVAFTVSRCGR